MTTDDKRPSKWKEGWDEFREESGEVLRALHRLGWGNLLSSFVVGLYLSMHFPFFLIFAHAMRVLTWPWAFVAGRLSGRSPHQVQPHLRFRCIVRSTAAFADSAALAPLMAGADVRERSALRLMPLLVGTEMGLTGFVNVLLLRAPFRLEPSGSKRFSVKVGEGEPLTRMDRAVLLGFLSLLPLVIVLSVLAGAATP